MHVLDQWILGTQWRKTKSVEIDLLMDLLPEQSMNGDIHGDAVRIYQRGFLVGKMIPMKYDMWSFLEQCRLHRNIHIWKKEPNDKPVDICSY